MAHEVPPNESSLGKIYAAEVAVNLLRNYVVTQSKPQAYQAYSTAVLALTALQSDLIATSNWSNLP